MQTLHEILNPFKAGHGYILCEQRPIYCPQVNGIVNLCLIRLGSKKEARVNLSQFLQGPSYNPQANLFYREVDLEGNVMIPAFNVCKNAVFALALSESGFSQEAEKIMSNLRTSPTYLQDLGLFAREYDPQTKILDRMVVTQSNLWAALAYSSIAKTQEACQLISNLEQAKFDADMGLFYSPDCSSTTSPIEFFLDDQALAIMLYESLGKTSNSRALMDSILESPLATCGLFNRSFSADKVDTIKSTYKNSLMAIAFGLLGNQKELSKIQLGLTKQLFDPNDSLFYQSTNDQTKIPDNTALAFLALRDSRFMMYASVF